MWVKNAENPSSACGLGLAIQTIGDRLQTFTIGHDDATAPSIDKALVFKLLNRRRDTGASHAKHQRQKIVHEGDLVAVDTIVRHEEPAS